ncbi:MAG: serine/threonine protein phosphatase PrpC [Pirellulaceae bacterium]|jgi:serine/threonine protein phosphatase PrpC
MSNEGYNADLSLDYVGMTDIGMRRANNQDSHILVVADAQESWETRGHVFMVADGMGAHAAGELASKLACEGIPTLYYKYHNDSPPEALKRAIEETNAEVNRRGDANAEFDGMGTTTSVLAILPQGAFVGHVGDSRVYRLRSNTLEQLTFDHSLVWELRTAGEISPDNIPKNVITRSLGPYPKVQVDIEGPHPVELGDTFLLCSDGLSGEVEDDEIAAVLASLAPTEAAEFLINLANLRGGPDNITVIVVKATGEEVTSRVAASKPIVIGASKEKANVHPGVWAVTGVCFLTVIVMLLAAEYALAICAGIGGIAALLFALYKFVGTGGGGRTLSGGQRLGKGPYTQTPALATSEFIAKLSGMLKQLRELAEEKNWEIGWPTLEEHCQQAESASSTSEAVRHYGRAISFMMEEIRQVESRKASDSTIDY